MLRLARQLSARGVEGQAINRVGVLLDDVRRVAPISGEREAAHFPGGQHLRRRRAERAARCFVDRNSPEVHCPVAIGKEVKSAAIRPPDRVPVDGGVLRHRHGLLARGKPFVGNRPNVPLAASGRQRPVGDAQSVGRDARLDGIEIPGQLARLAAAKVDCPDLALSRAAVGPGDELGGIDDLPPVW